METIRDLQSLKFTKLKSVITIGVFDGVHKGHQKIIGTVAEEAKKRRAQSIVVTFEPHPREVLNPGTHPPVLTGSDLKAKLIEKLGVELLVITSFTEEFSLLTPEQFVKQVLLGKLRAECVVAGANFKFGKNAQGDVNQLKAFGDKYGFDVVSVPPVKIQNEFVSSTLVRKLLRVGDVKGVREILGRFPRIGGEVAKGHGRGKKLGFPTANIETFDKELVPKNGVYAGYAYVYGNRKPCVIDIGSSPTFGKGKEIIHVHVFDFNENLYRQRLEVEIAQRIRDERSFPDEAALKKQIAEDIQAAQEILSGQQQETRDQRQERKE